MPNFHEFIRVNSNGGFIMKIDLLDRPRLELLNKRGLKYHLQDAEKIRVLNDRARPRDPEEIKVFATELLELIN